MIDLRAQASKGVLSTGVSTIIITLLQFVQTAVLGRILGPSAFGLMAMVLIVMRYAQLYTQMGLVEALIQRKTVTDEEVSTLFWANIFLGIIVMCTLWFTAPLIAHGFNAPELTPLIQAMSISVPIAALGLQYMALLQKQLRFGMVALCETAGFAVNFIVSIITAIYGQGVWSLIWGLLAGTLTSTLCLVIYGMRKLMRPRFHFRWSELKSYLSFGIYRVGSMSLNYLTFRIDQILIGIMLGTVALGYYSMAWNLVIYPMQRLIPIITRVSFPVLAQVQDDQRRLRRGYVEMINLLSSITAPLMFGIASIAPIIVPIWLGPDWQPVILLIPFLAMYAYIRSLGNPGGSLMMATGHADWTLYWNVLVLAITIPTVLFVIQTENPVGVAAALAVLQPPLMILHYFLFLRPIIPGAGRDYLFAFAIPTLLGATMYSVLTLFIRFTPFTNSLLLLVLLTGLGAAVYCGMFVLFQPHQFHSIVRLLRTGSDIRGISRQSVQ